MATTLLDLRQLLGKPGFCGDIILSSFTFATTSTNAIDSSLGGSDGAYNNGYLRILQGLASTNERTIDTWIASTKKFTPIMNFTAAVSSGNTYELHRQFSPLDKDAAIQQAIRESGEYWLAQNEDESITLSSATAYSLATISPTVDRSLGVKEVRVEPSSSTAEWDKINGDQWYLRDDAGVLYLQFKSSQASGQKIRIVYDSRPTIPLVDGTALNPDEPAFIEWILYKASQALFQKKADLGEEGQREHWQLRSDQMDIKAERVLARWRHNQPNPASARSSW